MSDTEKLSRLEILYLFHNTWLEAKVAAELDLTYTRRLTLAEPGKNLQAKAEAIVELESNFLKAKHYLEIIEKLIKQEQKIK